MYVVLETSSGNYPVLLTSKTRVAPLTKQSIPRLELFSGVILARLASSVKEALQSQVQIDKTYLWLDSKTAIYWIKGSKEWKQFVQNSVTEILTINSITGRVSLQVEGQSVVVEGATVTIRTSIKLAQV